MLSWCNSTRRVVLRRFWRADLWLGKVQGKLTLIVLDRGMTELRRIWIPGGTVFFTVGLARPGSWLLVEQVDLLRLTVGQVRRARPFDVLAWVVLPDRMHAIWKLPEGDCAYDLRWAAIKGQFSRSLRAQGLLPDGLAGARAARGEVGLWQKRYWEHHIRGAEDLKTHLTFCREAAVAAGLVHHPGDWPFSSFAHGQGARGKPRATQGVARRSASGAV